MESLDGNAIAGLLHETFGVELTAAHCVCAACAATRPVAELDVYLQAPGVVARCRSCGNVTMVLVTVRGITCVDLLGLSRLDDGPGTAEAAPSFT
jgi:hypothetical protein